MYEDNVPEFTIKEIEDPPKIISSREQPEPIEPPSLSPPHPIYEYGQKAEYNKSTKTD